MIAVSLVSVSAAVPPVAAAERLTDHAASSPTSVFSPQHASSPLQLFAIVKFMQQANLLLLKSNRASAESAL